MNQKGYSLLEVILVILLSSIIGSSIVVTTKFVEEVRFKTLVSEVEAGIRQAQRYAVATGEQYDVQCQEKKIIVKASDKSCIHEIKIDSQIIVALKDEKGKEMTGKRLGFHASMAPLKAGTIVLVDHQIKQKALITVRVATGKTTVYFEAI